MKSRKRNHFRIPLALSVLLSLCNAGHATESLDSDQAFFLELPVVLTPSRLEQPLDESPNAMTVIDAQMIRASGFRKLSEIFRLVPGMYVGSQNGHASFVSYHGTTDNYARRMQVLVDGRSVYLPPNSAVTWENIPVLLESIERIEVVRGPSAASHGANSTQGVINIITREPSIYSADFVSVAQGGNGVADLAASFGTHSTVMDQRLNIGYQSDQGYDWSLINDANRTRMISWRGNYHPTVSDSFDIQLGYSEADRGEGVKDRATSPFRDSRHSYNYQQLIWTRSLESTDEVRVNYQHSYSRLDDIQTHIPETYRAHRHDLEMQHTIQLHSDNRLVWGMGMRSDKATSPQLFIVAAPTLIQSRFFAHDEWRLGEAAVINTGAMWEDDGMGHSNLSPRLSMNYHMTHNQTLRIGSSLAYRNPAIIEEYGNTDLTADHPVKAKGGVRPERMLSREIGYLGIFPDLGLTFDARVYSDQLSDLIFVDPICTTPPLCKTNTYNSFKNYSRVNFQGWESTLKYKWNQQSGLTFNYARQRAAACSVTDTISAISDPAVHSAVKDYLNGELQKLMASCARMVPVNSGSLLLDHSLNPAIQLSAGYYFQDEVQVMDAQNIQRPMHRVDIKITRTFGKRDEVGGGEVSLAVQNMFRDTHTEYSSIPGQGEPILDRRAYILATFHY